MVLPKDLKEYKDMPLSEDSINAPKSFACCTFEQNKIKIVDIENFKEQITFQGPTYPSNGETI